MPLLAFLIVSDAKVFEVLVASAFFQKMYQFVDIIDHGVSDLGKLFYEVLVI